ncbi:Ig-like domain-containing protein [Candidatus Omnitrophota bacterium]
MNNNPPANNAPVAKNRNVSTTKNTVVHFVLQTYDPEKSTLDYELMVCPSNGTLSGTVPNLTYTPRQDFTGEDFFSFHVTDGEALSNRGVITVSVKNEKNEQSSY